MGEWFTCPECGRDLEVQGHALVCSSGHRFELGRRGYAALVVGRSAHVRSDPVAALDAVDERWESGAMDGVADAVVAMLPAGADARVLDCGADLGWVVGRVRSARPGVRALSVGSSPSALVRAMGRGGGDGVLVDPSRHWPIRNGIAEVVTCVFAEHRPAEFHRVLAAGGVAILAVDSEQAWTVDDDLYPWFEHDQTRTISAGGDEVAILRYRRRRRPTR